MGRHNKERRKEYLKACKKLYFGFEFDLNKPVQSAISDLESSSCDIKKNKSQQVVPITTDCETNTLQNTTLKSASTKNNNLFDSSARDCCTCCLEPQADPHAEDMKDPLFSGMVEYFHLQNKLERLKKRSFMR